MGGATSYYQLAQRYHDDDDDDDNDDDDDDEAYLILSNLIQYFGFVVFVSKVPSEWMWRSAD